MKQTGFSRHVDLGEKPKFKSFYLRMHEDSVHNAEVDNVEPESEGTQRTQKVIPALDYIGPCENPKEALHRKKQSHFSHGKQIREPQQLGAPCRDQSQNFPDFIRKKQRFDLGFYESKVKIENQQSSPYYSPDLKTSIPLIKKEPDQFTRDQCDNSSCCRTKCDRYQNLLVPRRCQPVSTIPQPLYPSTPKPMYPTTSKPLYQRQHPQYPQQQVQQHLQQHSYATAAQSSAADLRTPNNSRLEALCKTAIMSKVEKLPELTLTSNPPAPRQFPRTPTASFSGKSYEDLLRNESLSQKHHQGPSSFQDAHFAKPPLTGNSSLPFGSSPHRLDESSKALPQHYRQSSPLKYPMQSFYEQITALSSSSRSQGDLRGPTLSATSRPNRNGHPYPLSALQKTVEWMEPEGRSPSPVVNHLSARSKNIVGWLQDDLKSPSPNGASRLSPNVRSPKQLTTYKDRAMSTWQTHDVTHFLREAMIGFPSPSHHPDYSLLRSINGEQLMMMTPNDFEKFCPGGGHLVYESVQQHKDLATDHRRDNIASSSSLHFEENEERSISTPTPMDMSTSHYRSPDIRHQLDRMDTEFTPTNMFDNPSSVPRENLNHPSISNNNNSSCSMNNYDHLYQPSGFRFNSGSDLHSELPSNLSSSNFASNNDNLKYLHPTSVYNGSLLLQNDPSTSNSENFMHNMNYETPLLRDLNNKSPPMNRPVYPHYSRYDDYLNHAHGSSVSHLPHDRYAPEISLYGSAHPSDPDVASSDEDEGSDAEAAPPPVVVTPVVKKRGPGRPPKPESERKKKKNKTGRLWEFIRNLLLDPETCPSLVKWDDAEEGIFRFVQSEKVAERWGMRKNNKRMNYEKLSRAMRYYYKGKVFEPMLGKRLVYRFGINAKGWKPNRGNFDR